MARFLPAILVTAIFVAVIALGFNQLLALSSGTPFGLLLVDLIFIPPLMAANIVLYLLLTYPDPSLRKRGVTLWGSIVDDGVVTESFSRADVRHLTRTKERRYHGGGIREGTRNRTRLRGGLSRAHLALSSLHGDRVARFLRIDQSHSRGGSEGMVNHTSLQRRPKERKLAVITAEPPPEAYPLYRGMGPEDSGVRPGDRRPTGVTLS
ncbi:MAG: hypothetical protein ACREDE_00045 [Thermoplasmata archaeon]